MLKKLKPMATWSEDDVEAWLALERKLNEKAKEKDGALDFNQSDALRGLVGKVAVGKDFWLKIQYEMSMRQSDTSMKQMQGVAKKIEDVGEEFKDEVAELKKRLGVPTFFDVCKIKFHNWLIRQRSIKMQKFQQKLNAKPWLKKPDPHGWFNGVGVIG